MDWRRDYERALKKLDDEQLYQETFGKLAHCIRMRKRSVNDKADLCEAECIRRGKKEIYVRAHKDACEELKRIRTVPAS